MASLIIFAGITAGIVLGVANFLTGRRGPWLLALTLLGCSGPPFEGGYAEPEPEPELEGQETRELVPRPPLDRASPSSPRARELDPKLKATFTVSSEYTDEQIAIIGECFDAWRDATDRMVNLEMVIGEVDGQPFTIAPTDELPSKVTGRTLLPNLDRIVTARWLERGPSLFRVTVCHELGHFLGLLHVDDVEALMWGGNYQVSEPQPIDIAQFWERHAL
jgi:hypothetical protein